MTDMISFAGISGSLRKDSYNTKLLRNLKELMPPGTRLDILSIQDIPLYNGDDDLPIAKKRPRAVETFRDKLAQAQALVIVSPEYNYSIPGVLKNALDWASRGEDSPLLRKPVALMGATPGMWGTSRMQLSFHAIFQYLDMKPVYKPEILIARAKEKFDAHGFLTDEKAKEFIKEKLEALRQLVSQA
jgi:chromate reductase